MVLIKIGIKTIVTKVRRKPIPFLFANKTSSIMRNILSEVFDYDFINNFTINYCDFDYGICTSD